MRIWVDPLKLRSYNLTIADVSTAVSAQNAQVSAGQIGQLPASKEQQLNATVSVQSRLQTPEQFGNIRLRMHTRPGAVSSSPYLNPKRPRYSLACTRSEEHTSELQSLMRISYAVFCLKKKT